MVQPKDIFHFEEFLEYYGAADTVKKIIHECPVCGAKLVFGHMSDFKTLFIQETARCLECGQGIRKIIHVIH